MKLVIIGGDAAGMSAATQARRLDPDAEIIVLEQGQDVSYGACGLPYKLPRGRDMEDLKIITAEQFREERGIDLRLGHRVEAIDPQNKEVRGSNAEGAFSETYHKLIIATGARVRRPPVKGLDELWHDGVYPLKTLQDGRALKKALAAKPADAVVVGAGYIGLEATEGLRERGMEVTIVEALPELLPFLPTSMQQRVKAEAEAHQVPILLGTLVKRVSREEDGRLKLQTTAGELRADLVMLATGVQPNSELAREAGLALGAAGSIATDPLLYTSDPHILAAGDCADAIHGVSHASTWSPLALRANRAGKLAGANALGGEKQAPPVMGTAVFKFFDLQIARAGLSLQEAEQAGMDLAVAEIKASTRAHYYPGGSKMLVWLAADRATRKLAGGAMVGPEGAAHRIDTVAAALHGGFTAEQVYDMDLAYAPPFGPSWSPLLICASKLSKALSA